MNAASLAQENIDRYGEYVGFHYEGRAILNTEQQAYSRRLAGVLLECGVVPGDRVLVMMPNSPEALAGIHAAWTVGAVAVPVAPQLTAREAAYVALHSGARVALTVPSRAPVLAESVIRELLVFGPSDVSRAQDISGEAASATPAESPVDRKADDMAMLLYTSGTTARPKGVVLTHRNVLACCEACTGLNPNVQRCTFLQLLPLHHVYGTLMFNLGLAWGFTSVILPGFDPARALQAIQDHKVSRTAVVPAMMVYLMLSPDRAKYDTSSLRLVLSGGGPLPEELRVQFERVFGCRVNQGYGLSETMSVVSAFADDEDYRPGSAGRAMPGVEVAITGVDGGKPLKAGERGEICVRGPVVFAGYWNDPEATRAAFRDEWHLTGDVGYQDADGYLYIVERKKDLIIKGGENISPREIEEVIHGHPAVAEAAVIGVPDTTFGENICAVVVLKPEADATADDIGGWAERHLMKFKLPSRIVIAPALPRNVAGKVLKRELRERLAESASTA
jgi:long-chain acyl-CoA synthetase